MAQGSDSRPCFNLNANMLHRLPCILIILNSSLAWPHTVGPVHDLFTSFLSSSLSPSTFAREMMQLTLIIAPADTSPVPRAVQVPAELKAEPHLNNTHRWVSVWGSRAQVSQPPQHRWVAEWAHLCEVVFRRRKIDPDCIAQTGGGRGKLCEIAQQQEKPPLTTSQTNLVLVTKKKKLEHEPVCFQI